MQGKVIRLILDLLIAFFFLCLLAGVYWYIHGSFELVPTQEQQEKALVAAITWMIGAGSACTICIVIRFLCRKKHA